MVLNLIGAVLPLLVQDIIDRLVPGFTMEDLTSGAAKLLGLIVQSGHHQHLLQQKGPYQQLWRRQQMEIS